MKTKLLKKLRKLFKLEYIPAQDVYVVIYPKDCWYDTDPLYPPQQYFHPLTFEEYRDRQIQIFNYNILRYARINYSKYGKKITIKYL